MEKGGFLTGRKLLELYEMGKISRDILFVYGIAGELPDPRQYMLLTSEQKIMFWDDRMRKLYGSEWRSIFQLNRHNWSRQGF